MHAPPRFRQSKSNLTGYPSFVRVAPRECNTLAASGHTASVAPGATKPRSAAPAPSGSNSLSLPSAVHTSRAVYSICMTEAGCQLRAAELATLRRSPAPTA